jgi:2-desacetyl-2-hydroxyethyl bacteriochlorophyllide A dehydrogenase
MKYIVCEAPHQFVLKEKNPPNRKKGEALLKILRIGICGTDLHAYQGNQAFFSYPRILGHELAAEIMEIDVNDKGLQKGDKVIIMPYLSCGKCIACRNEKTNCCSDIEVLGVHTDGGMQEILSLPIDILIPAGDLSAEAIAMVEPLSIGAHCLRRANPKSDETILVIGCGPIGLGVLKQAELAGNPVIAMDVNPERLTFVREQLGIKKVVNALEKPLEKILAMNQQDLPTIVIDATGNKKAIETGIEYMAHGGKYVLVGLSKGDLTFNNPYIHKKETTLICSRNATLNDFLQVKKMLEQPTFPLSTYISQIVPFEEMIPLFDDWTNPNSTLIKTVISLES